MSAVLTFSSQSPIQRLADDALLARLYDLTIAGAEASDEYHDLDAEVQQRFHYASDVAARPASMVIRGVVA